MIEVAQNVYVGNQDDADFGWKRKDNWAFVYCAKEPYHRNFVGYTSRGCPKDSPEYLYAFRENSIALNMVDVEMPEFFDKDMIQTAMGFAVFWGENKKLLFCCNQGASRSPSMAMLYLAIIDKIPKESFEEAENAFKQLYRWYNPKNGIRTHLKNNWEEYAK